MQPISNNDLYTSTTSNNITTVPIQETSRASTQATAEYPILNSRKITNNSSNLQSEDSIFINKWFPMNGASIYKNFHGLLSIDSYFAIYWKGVAKAYNMSDEDIKKIRSEAKDTGKLYSEILINHIIELYADKNTETILLDFYNKLKRVNYSLSQTLKHWVESIAVDFNKTTSLSVHHDVTQYEPRGSTYSTKQAIPHPIPQKVSISKPPQVSIGSNIQVTNNSSVDSILMNKWFPQPDDPMYKHLHDILSIHNFDLCNWEKLASQYGMTVDDTVTIKTEAMFKTKYCSEVLIDLILEKQKTIDETTILLDFYNKLKLVHGSLASELLEWAKTQPTNPRLSKVKINDNHINYYERLKKSSRGYTNNQTVESILINKQLPQKGDDIYDFLHRQASKYYYNTISSDLSGTFSNNVLECYNIQTVNEHKSFTAESINKKMLPSELLVSKIEEIGNKKTRLLGFYKNIKKIDNEFANILLIWAANQPVVY
jgi:hypothetical protein